MLFENTISTQLFRQWLLQDRENRRLLWLSGFAIIIQFLLFKMLYPFPNFMPPDSFSYLQAANDHQAINIWAIGYSWFLNLFRFVTRHSISLVWCQYLLVEVSLLYFLFSIRYLLSPGKWLFRIILAFSVLNPLLPHVSNFISSDALFATLSQIWFTQLLWLLYKPRLSLLVYHALIILLAFTVRYNALYYPLISSVIILFSLHLQTRVKGMAIGLIIVLLFLFIGKTQNEYYKQTGTLQFSAFGGWQIGSNALYGYARAPLDSPSAIPERFRKLHAVVNRHMKFLNRFPYFLRPDHKVDIYYLWDFNSPLRVYMDERWKKDSTTPFFNKWAAMAPLYSDYGCYLIEHHPGQFIQYYIWPNFIKYYAPPTGFLGYYNLKRDTVDKIAVVWFGWKNNKIHTSFKNKEIRITEIFTIGMAVINLAFLFSFLAFAILGGLKTCLRYCKSILLWMLVVWFSNMIFSVVAAPIELRYQLFPLTITFTFLALLLAYVISKAWVFPNPISTSPNSMGKSVEINAALTNSQIT